MTEAEKMNFLSDKIKELNIITSEIEKVFPEKSFKLDGILVGNIVEVMAAHVYGITLYKQSEKTHDGEVAGKKVQIKGTQKKESIVIREEPDYLIVNFLDKENGTIQEIYNGPGSAAWECKNYVPGLDSYTIRVSKLLELDATIPNEDRIPQIVEIEKFSKCAFGKVRYGERRLEMNNQPKKTGKTVIAGYVNKNNQENLGCLNKPGNHPNQTAYALKCGMCGFEYEANGCDIAIRKCPRCM